MRIFFIVLDSLGVGNAPDANTFNDSGSDTLGHIADAVGDFSLPTLESLGLGVVKPHPSIAPLPARATHTATMSEVSASKDTSAGHWEMMGAPIDTPFPRFPDGFPPELMKQFTENTGTGFIGNRPASGTEIIRELGQKHINTGDVIVYTSADSVFQIAAHEDVVAPERLYDICRTTRTIVDEYQILRVIARPFTGKPGEFTRRNDLRHDYSMKPISRTYLEDMRDNGITTISVGKINDIFAGVGIDQSLPSKSNADGMQINRKLLTSAPDRSFIFTNLVEFDAVYGHRRNVSGYYDALREFDTSLPEFLAGMRSDDHLFITADHGCDPTYRGTDHTRENVPLIVYSPSNKRHRDLGMRRGFHFAGRYALSLFGITPEE